MPGRRRWRQGQSRRVARMLNPTLLLLLHNGPAHGYTLLEQLDSFGLGGLHPSMVYRTLREMEEGGWLTSTWDTEQTQGPPRRVYRLTALGNEVLAHWTSDLEQTRALIDRLLDSYHDHMRSGKGDFH